MSELERIKPIFSEALDKKGRDRQAYLNQACSEDSDLKAKVEALLNAHENADDFLESPLLDPDVTLNDSPMTEGPGTVIGPYKILEKIGEGGMAVVYMAEQHEPFHRRVALKIIKLGMDTRQVISRFGVERQALAMMDHPNIAKVYDASATETGRPYFVMELVRGLTITEYCDTNKLNTQERLDLLIPVCNAVQHAHQKGIIHRDIKPSNIMVTLHDGKSVPKVIDFGIAKATNQRLTERTVFTRYAEMIGTPEYMSPEQAEMSGLDVDTRTDIYSLGVVLYELLTGALPFDPDTLRSAAMGEIQRIIREEEPPRPSTRLSGLGEQAKKIAASRSTDAASLAKRLHRELEWIPLKAMRKDRTRRYRSASEFADDIENYLNGSPLIAGPESAAYRFRKMLRRYRVPAAVITTVAASLIIGFAVSTSLYVRMRRALSTVSQLESKAEVDSKLSTVQRLYAEGRYQAALNEIEVTLEVQDLGRKAHLLRAQLLLEVGRFEHAEEKLLQLAEAEPEIAGTAHLLLARANIAVDSAKADRHKQLAESILPQTAEAYLLRAMTADSPDQALTWLSKALELDPRHYASRKARAFTYYSLEEYQKMAEDVGALIILRPSDYLGYALRAIVLRETGRFEEALKDHARAFTFCTNQEELPKLYDQRRETHMRNGNYRAALEDAREYARLKPNQAQPDMSRMPVFYALLSLGQYDQAQAEYRDIAKKATRKARGFKAKSERYVRELLSKGRSFDLPPDIAIKSPFYMMEQSAKLYKKLKERARPLPIFSGSWLGDWSPDGRRITYSRLYNNFTQLPGTFDGILPQFMASGIEILDLDSGKTRQVSRFGSFPNWSPDGKYITFGYTNRVQEIWLVPSTGGHPRKLAEGIMRGWSRDSSQIFFRNNETIYSLNVDLPDAEPVLVHNKPEHLSILSPDGSLRAIRNFNEIRILTVPEDREVMRWEIPWPLESWATQLQWHPNSKTVILDSISAYNQMGMCLLDIEQAKVFHVFNLTRPWCRSIWSPDGSQLIMKLYGSGKDVWLLDLDPNLPLTESLAPALTTEEFLGMLLEKWNQRIEADPQDADNYVSRAIVSMAVKDYDGARQDLRQCGDLIRESDDPALHAIELWGWLYLKHQQYRESEMWLLQAAQIIQRFPEHYPNQGWLHPYRQLVELYAAQDNRDEIVKLKRQWQRHSPLAPGSLRHDKNSDTYTITGPGSDIWGVWDEFHFAYQRLRGDGSIIAKIEGIENTHEAAKAGLMIRNTLEPDSQHAAVFITPARRVTFQHRKTELQKSFSRKLDPNSITLPHWVKLERKGNTFTAQHSKDGLSWEDVSNANAGTGNHTLNIEMSDTVYIGLAVTSHAGPSVTAEAKISNVKVTGMVTSIGPFTESKDIGFPIE